MEWNLSVRLFGGMMKEIVLNNDAEGWLIALNKY